METAQEFEAVVRKTRDQFGGITLDLMARILASVLDKAELEALMRDLQVQVDNKVELETNNK